MCYQKWMAIIIVLLGLGSFTGCATFSIATGIGEHKVNETTGAMAKDYPKPMKETWDASLTACNDLWLKITEQKYDPQQSCLTAIQPGFLFTPEQKVKVELTAKNDQITTVVIRYGPESKQSGFAEGGLQKYEKDLHGQIMNRLGMKREMTPGDFLNLMWIP